VKIGITGLAQVGKSTLFQLLTEGAEPATYGKAGIGVAKVPDRRINILTDMFNPRKTIFATLDFVDVEGFVPGQNNTPFLNAIRDVDALVQVVRAFEDPNNPRMNPAKDAAEEVSILQDELVVLDWSILEAKMQRMEKEKKKVPPSQEEVDLIRRVKEALEAGRHLRSLDLNESEEKMLSGYTFLTDKPLIVVVNVDESQLKQGDYPGRQDLENWAREQGVNVLLVAAQIEWEISRLPEDESEEFMQDIGLSASGVERVAQGVYRQLDLISFFTVGEDEVKAWTIKTGTPAVKAAGKIHSDIERGFIRAEVIAYDDLMALGSIARGRQEGKLRLEGKDYKVLDGDIINFRFNV
jgi:GTP-binding protein YchF